MASKFQVENVSETTQKSPKCLRVQGGYAPLTPSCFYRYGTNIDHIRYGLTPAPVPIRYWYRRQPVHSTLR